MGYTMSDVMKVAYRAEGRAGREKLREVCDAMTGGRLDDWELDRMAQRVEEHPAYRAIPESMDEEPLTSS